MSFLVSTDELKTITGCKRMTDLEACLRKNGVRFLYGKSGIYTTIDALNAAMGLKSGELQEQRQEQEQDFDIL